MDIEGLCMLFGFGAVLLVLPAMAAAMDITSNWRGKHLGIVYKISERDKDNQCESELILQDENEKYDES